MDKSKITCETLKTIRKQVADAKAKEIQMVYNAIKNANTKIIR